MLLVTQQCLADINVTHFEKNAFKSFQSFALELVTEIDLICAIILVLSIYQLHKVQAHKNHK